MLEEIPGNPLKDAAWRNASDAPLLRRTERLGSVDVFRGQMRSARKLPLLKIPILENEKVLRDDQGSIQVCFFWIFLWD